MLIHVEMRIKENKKSRFDLIISTSNRYQLFFDILYDMNIIKANSDLNLCFSLGNLSFIGLEKKKSG